MMRGTDPKILQQAKRTRLMTSSDPQSPDQGGDPDEAVWLDLVSRLEGTSSTVPPSGEASSPLPRPFRDFDPLGIAGAAPAESAAPGRQPAVPAEPGRDAGSGDDDDAGPGAGTIGPRDYDAGDDGEFVPEDPPSLAGTDPLTMLAWLGALGGPLALLFCAMFWRSAPLLATLGIVAVFVAAVIYLIMQLPNEKDEHDDGARV